MEGELIEMNNTAPVRDTNATKYCRHCGQLIDIEAVVCIKCGKQVEKLQSEASQPQVIINNTNANTNVNNNTNTLQGGVVGKPKNKWVAFCLCLFFGAVGGHKFYEGKVGMGIIYILLCCTLVSLVLSVIDLIAILSKPNPYYV